MQFQAAYYIAGHAVECGLKACIAKQTNQFDFPPKDAQKFYTHNITDLVKRSAHESDFDQERRANSDLDSNWSIVETWSESSRYENHSQREAQELYEAISDEANGVLACIKRYW